MRLDRVAPLQRGFDLPESKREPGTIPVITSAGQSGFHSAWKVRGPGVVLGRYGTIGDIHFVEEDFWPHNTTLWVTDFHGNDPQFVAYLLSSIEFAQYSDKTGVPGVNRNDLHSIKVLIPPVEEQRAINCVLLTWDRGIRQLSDLITAKLRFKQGLMQQLPTGKRRFPGFSQSTETHHTPCGELPIDWKMNPLSHITRELKRKNDQGVTRVLTASGNRGLVDQREFFNRKVAGEALDKYYLLLRGEFAYNRSLMRGYPYGATKRLDDYDCGVLSTLYLCFQLVSDECISDFLVLLFESGLLNSQLRGIARMGARVHGLLNVTADEFFDMVVPLPQREEQQRIVEIFGAIDRELGLLRKELDVLKTQKKGLMQKLLTGQVRVKVAPELKEQGPKP